MLSLRDALESALVEDPDDLATHYAYADFLQEQGDPRGEFIQVQIALEDPQRSEKERRTLQARAKDLLRAHQREWLGILADELFPSDGELVEAWPQPIHRLYQHQFSRGWLDSLVLHENSDYGFRTYRTELGSLLCLASEARLLRKLTLEFDHGLVEALLASPFLLNLRVFQLGRARRGFHDISPIGQSPHLDELIAKMPRIEELRLFIQGFDAIRLFALKNLSCLRILQIYYEVERNPLEVLAKNAVLSNLTHLLLSPFGPCIDLTGVRAVMQSRHLRSLTHLQLHRSDLGDVGCTEIVTSGILKRLKVLHLRHGEITDAGAHILADCPDLQRLELLDIERNALTQTGIDALRRVLGPALRGDNQQTQEELAERRYLYEDDFA